MRRLGVVGEVRRASEDEETESSTGTTCLGEWWVSLWGRSCAGRHAREVYSCLLPIRETRDAKCDFFLRSVENYSPRGFRIFLMAKQTSRMILDGGN